MHAVQELQRIFDVVEYHVKMFKYRIACGHNPKNSELRAYDFHCDRLDELTTTITNLQLTLQYTTAQ